MGCNGSSSKTKTLKNNKKLSYPNISQLQHPNYVKIVALDTAILNTVLKGNGKVLNLDLQNDEAHKQFVQTVCAGQNGAIYGRLSGITTIEVLLNDKVDDIINKKLIHLIKNQFPTSITKFTLKSLARKARSLKPYIDALKYAKVNIEAEL